MITPAGDPGTIFTFNACSRCLSKPCDGLRYGGAWPGRYIVVKSDRTGIEQLDCPFACTSAEELRELLHAADHIDLAEIIEGILSQLSPADSLIYDQSLYYSDFSDIAGRLDFIEHLWRDGAITVVRIPEFYTLDKRLSAWLHSNETLVEFYKRPEEQEEAGAAVTDQMGEEPRLTLSNPRWEHADEERKKESADEACEGDTIVLMADVSEEGEDMAATFDVFDATQDPPLRYETVKGTVKDGVAKAEWVVKIEGGEKPKIEFEGLVRSAGSGRAEVKAGREFAFSY